MIQYIPGRVVCPLAGLGSRAANASNRLVVDAATELSITGNTITLRDHKPRATKTPIADLVWLAEGPDERGARTHFTIHLEIIKHGRDYTVELHTHEPRPLRRDARDTSDIAYEPLEVVIDGRVLVDSRRLAAAVAHVPFARRAAAKLMTTRDHLAGVTQDPTEAGYRLLDQSIGIGAFGRGAMLVRARLVSLASSNARFIARRSPADARRSLAHAAGSGATRSSLVGDQSALIAGSLVDMLREGSWELAIEALTDRTLPAIVARDLELFGLTEIPLLRELRAGKMRRGQVLAFRFTPDGGEVRLDDGCAPLPNAADLARAYLEFHMLGGLLTAALAQPKTTPRPLSARAASTEPTTSATTTRPLGSDG